jgi:hypothetical protein
MNSNVQDKAPLDPDLVFGKAKPLGCRTVMFAVLIISTLGAAITVLVYFLAANQHPHSSNGPSHVINPVCNDKCV